MKYVMIKNIINQIIGFGQLSYGLRINPDLMSDIESIKLDLWNQFGNISETKQGDLYYQLLRYGYSCEVSQRVVICIKNPRLAIILNTILQEL